MRINPEDIIYLDNNATTALDPEVFDAMEPYLKGLYGNPSSIYGFGKQVGDAVQKARAQVAALIHCEPSEILFTSCGTESDNAAISSALQIDRDRQLVVTTEVEHSAIMKQADALARQGTPVTRLPVNAGGQIDLDALTQAVTDETAIVSVMWANNETGVLFPVDEIAEIARKNGAIFHTDAVQAVGKLPVDVQSLHVDFLSIAGHKLHAPKGIGVLYVRKGVRFFPQVIGGGQEGGKRGGTENVASIIALGKAAELAAKHLETEATEVRALRDKFEQRILEEIPGTAVNGAGSPRLPNTTNIGFDGTDAEGLLLLLDRGGVCASSGSACTTGSLNPSHVLTAMGLNSTQARASLRFSFSRYNTQAESDKAFAILKAAVEKLRSLRPQSSPVATS